MRLFLLLLLFTCVFGIDFKNKEDHSNYGEFKHNKEYGLFDKRLICTNKL